MKILNMLAMLLVIVGALNWGLVGAFDINLVTMALGGMPVIAKLVYILIGVSGLYYAYKAFKCRGCCSDES